MLGPHHHAQADGLEAFHEEVSDLRGERLLHLGPAGEQFHRPGQLRQADDVLRGDVANIRGAGERQAVMLADALDRDSTLNDQLLIRAVVGKDSEVEVPRREQIAVGLGHPPGRLGTAGLFQINAERVEEGSCRRFGAVEVRNGASASDERPTRFGRRFAQMGNHQKDSLVQ